MALKDYRENKSSFSFCLEEDVAIYLGLQIHGLTIRLDGLELKRYKIK